LWRVFSFVITFLFFVYLLVAKAAALISLLSLAEEKEKINLEEP